jgi:uncharacterized membrane protein
MTETRLRDTLSVFLILAHIGVPGLLLVVFVADGLTRKELTDSLTIVVPMLSLFVGLAVTHVLAVKKRSASRRTGPELSPLFVFFALLLPLLFVLLIAAVILLKSYNVGIRSFEDFKIALATLETIFGAYTGRVLASLFEKEKAP